MKKFLGIVFLLAAIGICPFPVLMTIVAFGMLLCGLGFWLS